MALASGGACPTSPSNWDAASCASVCTTTATTFTCDVSAAAGASRVTIVNDYLSTNDYEAWGDVDGVLFCCESITTQKPLYVHIEGSDYADTLSFTFSALAYNLNGEDGGTIAASIDGNDGNDTINGSHVAPATYYSETLNGGAGNDVIKGNGGADALIGGAGDDLMLGGAGNDTMDGGADNDELAGGAGNDLMLGSAGRDFMSGGDGDDDMDGGAGGDVLCGGSEAAGGDILDDGDNVDEGVDADKLWGANGLDEDICRSTSTKWDSFAGLGCLGNPVLATFPSECP